MVGVIIYIETKIAVCKFSMFVLGAGICSMCYVVFCSFFFLFPSLSPETNLSNGNPSRYVTVSFFGPLGRYHKHDRFNLSLVSSFILQA